MDLGSQINILCLKNAPKSTKIKLEISDGQIVRSTVSILMQKMLIMSKNGISGTQKCAEKHSGTTKRSKRHTKFQKSTELNLSKVFIKNYAKKTRKIHPRRISWRLAVTRPLHSNHFGIRGHGKIWATFYRVFYFLSQSTSKEKCLQNGISI